MQPGLTVASCPLQLRPKLCPYWSMFVLSGTYTLFLLEFVHLNGFPLMDS